MAQGRTTVSMKGDHMTLALPHHDLAVVTTAAELRDHYRAVRERVQRWGLPPGAPPPPPAPVLPPAVEASMDQPMHRIMIAVCRAFDVSFDQLIAKRGSYVYVLPRFVAMWLIRDLTHATNGEIAHNFGVRDPSSVSVAIKKVATWMRSDPRLVERLAALHMQLKDGMS